MERARRSREFKGEHICFFMFWMDETGDSMVRTVEFLDSKPAEYGLRRMLKTAKDEKMQAQRWFWRPRLITNASGL
jgi:hypothetical protein